LIELLHHRETGIPISSCALVLHRHSLQSPNDPDRTLITHQ
jgi:hypothetical protein